MPEWCRWLTPDDPSYLNPLSHNQLNLYAYCGNNPVSYNDPSGCFLQKIGKAFVAFVGSFCAEFSLNTGFGFDASASLFGVPIDVSVNYTESDVIVACNYDVDIVHRTETGVEIQAFGLITVGGTAGYEHSYFDELCECSFFDSTIKKSICPARKEYVGSDIKIGASLSFSTGIGLGLSLNFNVTQFSDELVDIFKS